MQDETLALACCELQKSGALAHMAAMAPNTFEFTLLGLCSDSANLGLGFCGNAAGSAVAVFLARRHGYPATSL